MIGATTENPSFEVIRPLLSRAQVYVLKPLEEDDLMTLLTRAISTDLVLKKRHFRIDSTKALFRFAGGDGRKLLNILDLMEQSAMPDEEIVIDDRTVTERLQENPLAYDKTGEMHYDIISAFIKSIRGSDPDAAVHYLGRLLEAGDLLSPCRRLLVIAAEDVGLAYPMAIVVTKACVDAALQVGLPDARLPLAEAAVLLATAPKSNTAHNAIIAAMADLKKGKSGDIPRQLQNVHADTTGFDNQQHYLYPHDFPNRWVEQQYLPDALKSAHYYEWGDNKTEQAAKAYWERIKGRKL